MTSLIEEELNQYEYQILTQSWDDVYGAAFNACSEICIENGWMDHFGFVTPKGDRAIDAFEKKGEKPKDNHPDASSGPIEDFDVGGRMDIV